MVVSYPLQKQALAEPAAAGDAVGCAAVAAEPQALAVEAWLTWTLAPTRKCPAPGGQFITYFHASNFKLPNS